MSFLTNKKALYRYGHKVFALIIFTLAFLIILQFTKIPIISIIQHNLVLSIGLFLTFYLFSSFVDDFLEGPTGVNHRGFWHSKKMVIICIIAIIVMVLKGMDSGSDYWYFVVAAVLSYLTHLFGDSLTRHLPS